MDGMLDDGDRWAAAVPALYPDVPEEAFRYRCFGAADDEEADRCGDDVDYVLCKRPRVVRVSPKPSLIPRRVTCPEEMARRQLETLSWLHRGVSPNLVRAKVDGDARLGVLPSVAVLHTLARAYVKEGSHKAAVSILHEMTTTGLGPRPNTFRVLLNTLLEPLMRFDQGSSTHNGANSSMTPRGVVEACSRILAARREDDAPALHPTTTTVSCWVDWCERVLEAARVVLVGARAIEEVSSLPTATRDGRACIGAKGTRTMATSAGAILTGGIINLVYWELSCLVLHTPPGSTPQLQTKLFDMTGLVLAALITAHGEADSAAYNQRYLGVCMKAGRFVQACSLLQSSSTLSTAVVADFLSMCTAHCISLSGEEEGWSVDATGTTVVTWERILTQLQLDVINLPPDTLLKAIAISYAPLSTDGTTATPHQLALLAATVLAWSQHPQAHSPVSIQVVYRIVMLACLKYSSSTFPDVSPEVAATLEDLTKLCLPTSTGDPPLDILLAWLEANVDRVAAALGDAKMPQFTPCVSINEICSLLNESSSLPLVASTRLAVRQLCTWLPEYWRYYLQGAKDHHRPTLHGSQGILRPGCVGISSIGLPAGLGGLLDQLLLHPVFKRDMLVPISTSAPNVSIPARRLVQVLPHLPLDAQGPILANLQACHTVWLRSILWGAMLRLSSGPKPPTPEVCKDYGAELDGLISKYIGTVEVGRGGLTPEDIAAMVTVSRVEGSAASSSSFYVMVPDTLALEQLACTATTVSPPFKEQHELLVRSQHRRAPQPTAATHSLIPQVPLSPAMEAFSGLMRKYSVATGAVLAVPFGALAGLSDLGVYGLIQLLKVKKVVWVTVLPLGISTIAAPALPSISKVISTLPPQSDDGSAWVAGMCACGGCAKSALLTGEPTLPAELKEAALFTPTPAVIHLGDILTKLGVVVAPPTNN